MQRLLACIAALCSAASPPASAERAESVGHIAVEAAFEIAKKSMGAHLSLDNARWRSVKEFIPSNRGVA